MNVSRINIDNGCVFIVAVGLYFAIILIAIPVLAAKEYTLNKLGLLWRCVL